MPTKQIKKGLGWRPELPDQRDFRFVERPVGLPAEVDLRSQLPPVYDQGQLGSCTANAIAVHLDFNRQKQGEDFITPSRLFVYYNERVIEKSVESDAGATIRDSVKAIVKYGAPREHAWPYKVTKFAEKPPETAFKQAVKYEAVSYYKLGRSLSALQNCLALGFPFVIGFTVYDSFYDIGADGLMKIPGGSEAVQGGHAVCVVGYKPINGKLHFIVRNSWGRDWADKGYFYMPSDYLMNPQLSSDFWTLRQVK